jgi:quercetin dioxygenase-like cupin family protein
MMYFDPHAHIHDHSADHPIVFMVIAGSGTVRLGGPDGEMRRLSAGEAVLWPPHENHTVWTEEETMEAIVVNLVDRPRD